MNYSIYFRTAACAIIIYDVTQRYMFDEIDKWIYEVDKFSNNNLVKILCGSKIDLSDKRVVTTEEGMLKAEQNGMLFIETSAVDGTNINELFELAAKEIKKRFEDGALAVGIKLKNVAVAPQSLLSSIKSK